MKSSYIIDRMNAMNDMRKQSFYELLNASGSLPPGMNGKRISNAHLLSPLCVSDA